MEREQLLGLGPLDAGLHEPAHRPVHHVERLGQLSGRPLRRGGRVVQLVREAGGHRAERREPLAVVLDAGDPVHHRRDLRHHARVHGRLREGESAEVLGRDDRHAADGLGPHSHAEVALRQHGDRARPGRRRTDAGGLLAAALDQQRLRRALDQQEHTRELLALLAEQLAGLELERLSHREPLAELLVVDARRTGRSIAGRRA